MTFNGFSLEDPSTCRRGDDMPILTDDMKRVVREMLRSIRQIGPAS